MKALSRTFFAVLASVFISLTCVGAESEVIDKRLFAGWKIMQEDGLGDVYYLYPDGLFVRQGVRRREFVTIGRWTIEEKKRLVLFDFELRNTTLSAEALAAIKAEKHPYDLNFGADEKMRWSPVSETGNVAVLQRIRDLPDRTENIYWGLGTDEDYDRALRREKGLPPKPKMEPNSERSAAP